MDDGTPTATMSQDAANASSETPAEEWEVQRDAHKLQGDDAFRSGDFAEAVVQYTHALSVDPTNHLILSNRSAAELKQGNKSKALQDARACIDANPTFAKGHSRLAAALQSLGRLEPAKSAYAKVLELDASNAVAKQGLEDCTQLLRVKEQDELKRMQEELKQKEQAEQMKEVEQKKPEAAGPADPEDDLLNDFFSEVENVTAKKPVASKEETASSEGESRENAIREQRTDLGTAESQIERLLQPRYEWRNLNPFHVLDLHHTASSDDISRRYKALSLLLHPDKCRELERAKEAYDEVQRAKTLLDDEDKARHARQLVEQGVKKGRQEWHANGEKESLEEVQSKCVQKIFAQIEHKRREVQRRTQKQEQRERQQEEEELQKEKNTRTFDKQWRKEERVEKRIGNWRDFQKKGSSKKQKM